MNTSQTNTVGEDDRLSSTHRAASKYLQDPSLIFQPPSVQRNPVDHRSTQAHRTQSELPAAQPVNASSPARVPANRPQPISGFQPAHGPPSGPPLTYCILPTHSTTAGFLPVPGIPLTDGPPPAHQLPPAPSEVKGYSFSDASYTVGNTSTIHQLTNVQNCGLLSCDGE